MPFDQSVIVGEHASERNGDLVVAWSVASAFGEPAFGEGGFGGSEDDSFQVYVGGELAWHGRGRSAVLPMPAGDDGTYRLELGAVGPGEEYTDFSAGLPAPAGTGDVVTLGWTGGTYEDSGDDLAAFRIYSSPGPGLPVSYAAPVATVVAYPLGILEDGFGLGGFGLGGFGRSASHYSWASGHLASGTWSFAVAAVDAAGNEGTPATFSVTVVAEPGPPAESAPGVRMTYTYDPGTGIATLSWLSPA